MVEDLMAGQRIEMRVVSFHAASCAAQERSSTAAQKARYNGHPSELCKKYFLKGKPCYSEITLCEIVLSKDSPSIPSICIYFSQCTIDLP